MPTKLTQRTLAQLDGTGKRRFIRDSDLTGFGIEVSAKGKAKYFVETRVKGTKSSVRTQLGNVDHIPLDEARAQAKYLLGQAAKGNDPRFRPEDDEPIPETLGATLQYFLQNKGHTLAQSTYKDHEKTFRNCFRDWTHLPTKQLTRSMVQTRYRELLADKSPAYVNKAFRNLRSILNFSGVSPNPVDVMSQKKLLVPVEPKTRFLTGSEIYDLIQTYKTFRPKAARVALFCIMTGVRHSEVLNLRWSDIRNGKAYFTKTKNKKAHFIPLVGQLEHLVGKRGAPEERVFGLTYSQYRRLFDILRDQLKFSEPWSTHDLRRTFSEHMNLIGYNETDIAIANNQSSTSVTKKHYLGGQLAKEQLLRRMLLDLQKQYAYYEYDYGGEVQKVPEDWVPVDMLEPELTEEDLAQWAKDALQERERVKAEGEF